MVERLKLKLGDFFASDKKLKIAVIVGIVGILVLLLSEYIPSAKTEDDSAKTKQQQVVFDLSEYENSAEERLCSILSKINGVGDLSVMVTLENSGKKVYTADEENSYSSGNDDTTSSNSRQYVVVQGDDGNDEALESESITPDVRGVIVVCEGADNPTVRENIVSAVKAAFNISTSSISVVKGENQDE